MITLAYYLLKVIFCSGILYGYYHLALRNKVFHQWNRFYLLGAVLVSTLLPLLTIHVDAPQSGSKVVTALQVVNGADEFVREANQNGNSLPLQSLAIIAYTLGAAVVLAVFILAIHNIRKMIRRNHGVNMNDFIFLNTTEPGTPFSFFRFLLWNREISLDAENGKRILEHELVHIREKHSHDKLFIQLVLVPFWVNPFFWLIRREITMIHEFIADRRSVAQGDATALARLLLETSYPGYAPMMTNTFFKTSIKRRLAMINMHNKPGLNYISRIMMIPILAILLFAFAVKTKTLQTSAIVPALDKTVTVVIDAGHGGDDAGVRVGEHTEKEISLALAKLVRELNTDPKLKIILLRESDKNMSLQEKVELALKQQPDLFISMHVNGSTNPNESGIQAYIPTASQPFPEQNTRLANILLDNLKEVYTVDKMIRKRSTPIRVLDQSTCPAAMLECGFLTNPKDLAFIANPANQEKIAKQVLRSISEYFSPNVTMLMLSAPKSDSVPKNRQAKSVTFVYSDGSNETLTPEKYRKRMGRSDITLTSDTIHVNGMDLLALRNNSRQIPDAEYYIDGKAATKLEVEVLNPDQISSMNVTKPADGRKGRIDINTKANTLTLTPAGKVDGKVTVNQGTKDSAKVFINGTTNMVTIKGDPSKPKPLMIVDGKEMSEEDMKGIDPNTIESINVLKGEAAEAIYKEKGKNGVVVITLKAKG